MNRMQRLATMPVSSESSAIARARTRLRTLYPTSRALAVGLDRLGYLFDEDDEA